MSKKLSYKSSGVDIDKANDFVSSIKSDVKKTMSKSALNRAGSFGALFAVDYSQYKKPVMVSSTDGVGTKLLIAQELGVHHTVGIDLVAMNVNDILCTGAKPLYFLDYIACGKLDPKVLKKVVSGIVKGCVESHCALIGGETAEMPGMYKPSEYDLAGFAVGVVDEKNIIDGSTIKEGDQMIGFPSSGFHSNGYSLVRKVFSKKELRTYAKEILKPTKIYYKEVMALLGKVEVKAIAHITGGAYYEKLTKVLPKGFCFQIKKESWPIPKIFQICQKKGRIDDQEMYKTFNMGIGLVAVVSQKNYNKAELALKQNNIKHFNVGSVIKNSKQKVVFD